MDTWAWGQEECIKPAVPYIHVRQTMGITMHSGSADEGAGDNGEMIF